MMMIIIKGVKVIKMKMMIRCDHNNDNNLMMIDDDNDNDEG